MEVFIEWASGLAKMLKVLRQFSYFVRTVLESFCEKANLSSIQYT